MGPFFGVDSLPFRVQECFEVGLKQSFVIFLHLLLYEGRLPYLLKIGLFEVRFKLEVVDLAAEVLPVGPH